MADERKERMLQQFHVAHKVDDGAVVLEIQSCAHFTTVVLYAFYGQQLPSLHLSVAVGSNEAVSTKPLHNTFWCPVGARLVAMDAEAVGFSVLDQPLSGIVMDVLPLNLYLVLTNRLHIVVTTNKERRPTERVRVVAVLPLRPQRLVLIIIRRSASFSSLILRHGMPSVSQ